MYIVHKYGSSIFSYNTEHRFELVGHIEQNAIIHKTANGKTDTFCALVYYRGAVRFHSSSL